MVPTHRRRGRPYDLVAPFATLLDRVAPVLVHAVCVVDLELVDDPALGSHLRLERGLVELAAEPAQRTLGLALHHTEQANGLLRHVGAVEDRGGRLQGQPAAGRVVDVQHERGSRRSRRLRTRSSVALDHSRPSTNTTATRATFGRRQRRS